MQHEKIFVRPDGKQIKITVSMESDTWVHNKHKWNYLITIFDEKLNTWVIPFFDRKRLYNLLSTKEKRALLEKSLEYVSQEEIMETKLELWELFKPE